jgi:hypothetical protein
VRPDAAISIVGTRYSSLWLPLSQYFKDVPLSSWAVFKQMRDPDRAFGWLLLIVET